MNTHSVTARPTKPLRRLATIKSSNVDKIVEEGEQTVRLCNYVDVYYNDRITGDLDFSEGSAKPLEVAKFGLRADDVIITKDSETPDDIAVPALVDQSAEGVVCGYHLAIIRPRTTEVCGPYLFWSLIAKPTREAFGNAAQGITRYGLTLNGIGSVPIPVPDLDTQTAIAAFLNREAARIDELIVKNERVVDCISAKWEALIHEARDEPEARWVRLNTVTRRVRRAIGETGVTYIPLGIYNRGRGFFKKIETDEEDLGDSDFFWVRQGDIVFSGQFAWEGAIGFVTAEEDGCVVSHRYPVYRTEDGVEGAYLYAFFRTAHGAFLMDNCSRGAAGRNRPLNTWSIDRELVLIPSATTQKKIVRLVALESRARRLIREYVRRATEFRTALVTAAVTGQIDVREKPVTVTVRADRSKFRLVVGAEIINQHRNNPKFGRVKLQKELYLAEAHVGISELEGNYLREAAGPLDRALIEETERALETAGFYKASQQDGAGTAVTYSALANAGQHASELNALLGSRADALQKLIGTLRDLDRREVEAVATLYAVWNDALIDGQTPDDDAIINGVLTQWHAEKSKKFSTADLANWLGWMKRHKLIPRGRGSKTTTGRLFV